MIWSREFVSGANDWSCGLQEAIVVTVYLFGYLCWPHTSSSLPPPGLEAPHRLSTRLHISQMLHPPTALLLSSPFLPFFQPPMLHYLCREANKPFSGSFLLTCLSCCLSIGLSTCCFACSGQTRLSYPPQSQSRGLGMRE